MLHIYHLELTTKQEKDVSFVDRTDIFDVMDGINWMDQMLYYAGIRKTSGQKRIICFRRYCI